LASALSSSQSEVVRLKEWQDIFKRVEADKAQQAAAATAAAQEELEDKLQQAERKQLELQGERRGRVKMHLFILSLNALGAGWRV
jgi:hypothetical protein